MIFTSAEKGIFFTQSVGKYFLWGKFVLSDLLFFWFDFHSCLYCCWLFDIYITPLLGYLLERACRAPLSGLKINRFSFFARGNQNQSLMSRCWYLPRSTISKYINGPMVKSFLIKKDDRKRMKYIFIGILE